MNRLTGILLLLWSNLLPAQPSSKAIDQYLAEARNQWDIPGMAVGIVKDGVIYLEKGYGVQKTGSAIRVDEHTLFAIASNTKAFTASALAQLVTAGKLDWKDPVKKYLPDFELYDSYVTAHTTIEDLLCHRVGLGTFSGDLMWYKSILEPQDLISQLKYLPQAYEFRDGYGYSNLMFIVAGEVIHQVTGLSWQTYIQQHFLEPLHMDRTLTSTNALNNVRNYAYPHKPYEDHQEAIPWVNWDNMAAAGGIISSAHDMCEWILMNLQNGIVGTDTILTPEQQNVLWTPHNHQVVSLSQQQKTPGHHFAGYGLGWVVSDYHNERMISHSGGYDGMYSKVVMLPEKNLGFVILTNTMKGIATPLAQDLMDMFLTGECSQQTKSALITSRQQNTQADDESIRTDKRRKKEAASFPDTAACGTYYSPIHGNVSIKLEQKQLRMYFENAPALSATLTHWHYNVWEIQWDEVHAWFDFGTVQFLLDNNLQITGMQFDVPNQDIFFDETNLKRMD